MARTGLRIVLVTIAYYIGGKVGLLLAGPTGFAAAIWPPAGLALAGLLVFGIRLWPGVFLGAFLVNLDSALSSSAPPKIDSAIAVALTIGFGAVFQAIAGTWMIRRAIGFPSSLCKDRDVLRFLFLGGPVSCVIGATLGVSALVIAGMSPADRFAPQWWTWWIGDVMGVLIVAPIFLIAFAAPRKVWQSRWPSVALPLGVTFATALVVFLYATMQEHKRAKLEFDQLAERLARRVEHAVNDYLDDVSAIESLYGSSNEVTSDEFRTFNERLLSRHPGTNALQWIPRVPGNERHEFEQAARARGLSCYYIADRDSQGDFVPAPIRAEYFPISFVEPLASHERMLGFDTASDPRRMEALQRARDTGDAVATSPTALVQDGGIRAGILVFKAIYRNGQPSNTVQQRRLNLEGFVAGVFFVEDIVAAALANEPWPRTELRIIDASTPEERLLYAGTEEVNRLGLRDQRDMATNAADPQWFATLAVGGRNWHIRLTPTQPHLADAQSLQSSYVFVGGLVFTAMLGAFLLIQSGRAAEVEELVVARTSELSIANEYLELQVGERERAEAALSKAHEELERRVRERTAELRASEARYQDLYDKAPDMFATVDASSHRILQCNKTFLTATGFEREDVIGLEACQVYHPDCLEAVGAIGEEFQHVSEVRDIELRLLRKTGGYLDVSLNVSAVRDADGNVSSIRCTWRDITERKKAEEKIRQQQADLAHVSRLCTMGEMAAGLAHEINQPLAAIAAYAEGASFRLRDENLQVGELSDVVDRISADAHRAGDVIRRLRRFVHKREPQRGPLDVNRLVQDVMQFLASDALQDQITVELNLGDDLASVSGDSVEIQQVLLNLIRNGFDAMSGVDPAHRVLSVDTARSGDRMVEVIVRDAGPGVSTGSSHQVFEAFYSSKSDGLGMGLAISRSIIESHGGRIWVAHRSTSGAEFHFCLPIHDGVDDDE